MGYRKYQFNPLVTDPFKAIENFPLSWDIVTITDQLEEQKELGKYHYKAREILHNLYKVYTKEEGYELNMLPYFQLENIKPERIADKKGEEILKKRRDLVTYMYRVINGALQKKEFAQLKDFFIDLTHRAQLHLT